MEPPSSFPIQQPIPISSVPPSQKLPIKRKTSHLTLTPTPTPTPFPEEDDDVISRQSPFKFHRIWSEPDEIRLLQFLLDSSNQGLLFPRDLGIFYNRFSGQMSQTYTKSQLSEKLRRLRKKFRVISSRIVKGLDPDMLSPQDRALYDLSKQLWDPEVVSSAKKPIEQRNKVDLDYTPSVPASAMAVLALPSVVRRSSNGESSNVKVSEVEVKDESVPNEVRVESKSKSKSSEVVCFVRKTLADVIDVSLKEIRMMIDVRGEKLEKNVEFEKRWREQYVDEFDVLAKRLKLIVERSSVVSSK